MADEVRDQRPQGWSWFTNDIIDQYAAILGPYALAVYMALVRMADRAEEHCHPSYKYLATLLGLSRPTVVKAIQRLKGAGLITVKTRHDPAGDATSNLYTLVEPRGGGKRSLPPSSSGLPPSQRALPQVVKEINQGGKRRLPKQETLNKKQLNKTKTPPRSLLTESAPPPTGEDPPARLRSDWQPTARDLAWAKEKPYAKALDLELETEEFVSYWPTALDTRGNPVLRTRRGWSATWRKRVERQYRRLQADLQVNGGGPARPARQGGCVGYPRAGEPPRSCPVCGHSHFASGYAR